MQNTPIWIAELVREPGVGLGPRHHAERRRDHRQEDVALVPAGAVEAQDEREEVERQRDDPQERHRRDVLRDVVRDRQQQDRSGGGQRDPQSLACERRRNVVVRHRGRRRGSARRGRSGPGGRAQAREPRRGAQTDEQHVAHRPTPRLRTRHDPGLEQERVADQREHRGEIRQREEAVRAAAGEASREPRLHQRARRREQEVGQADGRGQHAEDQPRGVLGADRLPEARPARSAARRRSPPAARHAAGSPSSARACAPPSPHRRNRAAARSGRTPGRWSTPRPSRRTTAGSAWPSPAARGTAGTRSRRW